MLTSRIIDWDMAALVPLEAAIKLPTFLSKTPSTDHHGEVDDGDRNLYIRGFRHCELVKRKNTGSHLPIFSKLPSIVLCFTKLFTVHPFVGNGEGASKSARNIGNSIHSQT